MITYASFCSIFLFTQNPERHLPRPARTGMALQSRLCSDDLERHLVTNNVSFPLPKRRCMSLVLFSKATNQPTVTEALLCDLRPEGKTRNYLNTKPSKRRLKYPPMCAKQIPFRAAAPSSVGRKTSKGRTGSLRCATRHFATELSLVPSLRQESCYQKYSHRKRRGFGLRRR